MKFQRYRCGACLHPSYIVCPKVSPNPTQMGVYPSYATLIEDPKKGLILFDTGYSQAFLDETESFPEKLYRWTTPLRWTEEESLVSQLRTQGLRPEQIDTIILSHFHADHVAALRAFAHAKLMYHSQALKPLLSQSRLKQVRRAFLRGLVPEDIEQRTLFVDQSPSLKSRGELYRYFRDAYDLFGDQSLIALDLPGHCAGHIGLMIPSLKTIFLADAIWHKEQLTHSYSLGPMTRFITEDKNSYEDTVAGLRAFRLAYPDFNFFACHVEEAIN